MHEELYRVVAEGWVMALFVRGDRVVDESCPLARKLFGGMKLEEVERMCRDRGWKLERWVLGDGPPRSECGPCHRADTVVDDGTGHA